MGKRTEKKMADSYLSLARLLQDASVVMGMRNSLGYTITAEERNMLFDIQEIFFPEQELPEDRPHAVLAQTAHILIDAWAGIPTPNLPSASSLKVAEYLAKRLRATPLHG